MKNLLKLVAIIILGFWAFSIATGLIFWTLKKLLFIGLGVGAVVLVYRLIFPKREQLR